MMLVSYYVAIATAVAVAVTGIVRKALPADTNQYNNVILRLM